MTEANAAYALAFRSILDGFGVAGFVGELDEAVAVIVLSLINGPHVIRRDPNTTAIAPDRLRICRCSRLGLRGLHRVSLLV